MSNESNKPFGDKWMFLIPIGLSFPLYDYFTKGCFRIPRTTEICGGQATLAIIVLCFFWLSFPALYLYRRYKSKAEARKE